MATLSGGATFEQKVVTVVNDDTTINNEITTQAIDNWIVGQIILSGSNVILFFSRTTIPA